MTVDVVVEDGRWSLGALAEDATDAALADAGLDPDAYEIALLACDDGRIAALNADFRGKAAPTNVLSWPSEERRPGDRPRAAELGDVAISFDTCAREAAAQGKAFEAHVTHLLVHATLHLLGYDHETEPEAEAMEGAERRILAKLGLSDPYADDVT